MLPVTTVQLFTEVHASPRTLIARSAPGHDTRWQKTGQADIGIVATLELQHFGEQGTPFTFGNCPMEHNTRNDYRPVFSTTSRVPRGLADHRRRDTPVAQGTSGVEAGITRSLLIGSSSIIILGHVAKPCLSSPGMQTDSPFVTNPVG